MKTNQTKKHTMDKPHKSKYVEFFYLRSDKVWGVSVKDESGCEVANQYGETASFVYCKEQAIEEAYLLSQEVKERLSLDYFPPVYQDVLKYGFERPVKS